MHCWSSTRRTPERPLSAEPLSKVRDDDDGDDDFHLPQRLFPLLLDHGVELCIRVSAFAPRVDIRVGGAEGGGV